MSDQLWIKNAGGEGGDIKLEIVQGHWGSCSVDETEVTSSSFFGIISWMWLLCTTIHNLQFILYSH